MYHNIYYRRSYTFWGGYASRGDTTPETNITKAHGLANDGFLVSQPNEAENDGGARYGQMGQFCWFKLMSVVEVDGLKLMGLCFFRHSSFFLLAYVCLQ
jgi:hypothetical protein